VWTEIKKHPVRFFALLCVACTAAYLGVLAWRLVGTLSSPDWCSRALQAERITPGATFVGLTTCVDLLKLQIESLATNSHIAIGAFALVLVVLIVIVIAGARLAGKGPGGIELNISPDEAAAAGAEHVRQGAERAEQEVKGEVP
jgi:hypothetical protein